jgi:hypothetical protein
VTFFHWQMFGLAFLIVVAILMVGVALQEWWEWRKP